MMLFLNITYFLLFIFGIQYINTFTFEETTTIRTRICNKLSNCNNCEDKNGFENDKQENFVKNFGLEIGNSIDVNIFRYGFPFVTGRPFFHGQCDCKKLLKAKTLCSELDKSDPLPGLKDIDLSGVFVNPDTVLEKEVSSSKNEKKNNFISKNLRFKQIQLNSDNTKKECNCENEKDLKSLFCNYKCKDFVDYIKNLNNFYENIQGEAEKLIEQEKKKFK
jgi:hypothetical protein